MPYAHEPLVLNNMLSSILSIVRDNNECRLSVKPAIRRRVVCSLAEHGCRSQNPDRQFCGRHRPRLQSSPSEAEQAQPGRQIREQIEVAIEAVFAGATLPKMHRLVIPCLAC